MLVSAKRAGWDQQDGLVTATDILDPPAWMDDGESPDVQGELVVSKVPPNRVFRGYTAYTVAGVFVDPKTIKPLGDKTELRSYIGKGKGTCKPGQTAERTGCTPARRETSGKAKPSGTTPTRRMTGAVMETVYKLSAKYADAKATAARFGKAGFSKLPLKAQATLTRTWGVARFVEHKLMSGFTKTRQLAEGAARERGLSEEQTKKLSRVLGTADLIAAWTINLPATVAVTGSLTAGKVASWVPVASLGYLAYSTARNPLATVRAARKLVGAKHKGNKQVDPKAFAESVATGIKNAGDQGDWYLALLAAALDSQGGDRAHALLVAEKAFRKYPIPQAVIADLTEKDVALFTV